jgi:tol-pal system-associated acyl-CoA thioesterase
MEFSLPVRVYIEDTDAGGIVYYVNYLKFMERARTDLLRSHGFDKQYIFNRALMFVVQKVEVDYLKPAALDDELEVSAKIIDAGRANILFEQIITRAGETLCRGIIRIVCVARDSGKPRAIPAEIMQQLGL